MSFEKERLVEKIKEMKDDLKAFNEIDFSRLDNIDIKEYSKVSNTIQKMIAKYEQQREDISQLFSKNHNMLKLNN